MTDEKEDEEYEDEEASSESEDQYEDEDIQMGSFMLDIFEKANRKQTMMT